MELEIEGKKLELTNIDKPYWPVDGYAKIDAINYYNSIASVILPYLYDRPLSLHRFPDGIDSEGFYQKDANTLTLPNWIQTCEIFSESTNKMTKYILCNDKPTLIFLVNLGCIEFNPWNSRISSLDYPDYLVLDIDPNEIEFEAVIEVIKTTVQVLDILLVPYYLKTSGVTGIHIYLPLQAKYNYDQVKNFANLINIAVNKKLPTITSLERSTHKRKNMVYLDYLQNVRGQTLAAPYSLRPKAKAPVSTPLMLREINFNLNPDDFNIKTIFNRLNKYGDLWQELFIQNINIEDALNKLLPLID